MLDEGAVSLFIHVFKYVYYQGINKLKKAKEVPCLFLLSKLS